jgi:hypothetical protein
MSVPGKASLLMKSYSSRATRRFPTGTRSVIILLRFNLMMCSDYRAVSRNPASGGPQQQVTPGEQRCP